MIPEVRYRNVKMEVLRSGTVQCRAAVCEFVCHRIARLVFERLASLRGLPIRR